MKVLQVNTVYPNGSTGRIAAEIAEYTARQDDASAVVAFGIGEAAEKLNLLTVRIGNPWERKLHAVLRKLFDAEGYASRRATKRLIRLCQEQQVDVVHLHNLHGCYLNLKVLFGYLQKANLPVIWTLHDCWPMTGHCAHFEYSGCERWKTQCRKCPEQRSYPVCIGFDGSKRNYRMKNKLFTGIQNLHIAAPCRWMRDIVADSYLGVFPTRVIYNGVDMDKFKPTTSDIRTRYGLENKRLLLAVASDWTERKGLSNLCRLPEMLDQSYQVAIVGLTPEQKMTLPASIIGVESLSSPEALSAWYSAADCFVNPTLEDTMPLVNLEALACGTPIAVFNTGGCPEAVVPGCGAVAEKGDLPELANAIRQICESNPDPNACMRQAKRFSAQNAVEAYYQLYQEAAG